jgi:hypothetical protein
MAQVSLSFEKVFKSLMKERSFLLEKIYRGVSTSEYSFE